MTNHTITQEELAYIDRYLHNELAEEELLDFHTKMESVPGFKEKVNEVQLMLLAIGESALEEKINTFHQEIIAQGHHKKNKSIQLRSWIIAASAVLILSVSLWLIMGKYSHEHNLYATYYKPDPGLMTAMSTTDHYDFEKAMVAYKNGEYRQAINAWSGQLKSKPGNDTLTYFLGTAYQAMGNADTARLYLSQIAEEPESSFYKEANWYLALLYLKINKPAEAVQYLKRADHSKAEELIHRLEK